MLMKFAMMEIWDGTWTMKEMGQAWEPERDIAWERDVLHLEADGTR
jgi:hypothetical protein